MDASATRALLATALTALLLVSACAFAAGARAAEGMGEPVLPEADAVTIETIETIEAPGAPEALPEADTAQPGLEPAVEPVPAEAEPDAVDVQPLAAEAQELAAEAQSLAARVESLAAEPEAPAPAPTIDAQPPATEPQMEPLTETSVPPATAVPESQPLVEPERPAGKPKRDRGARLVAEVDRRLRAVEQDLREVRRQLATGTDDAGALVRDLRRDVRQLMPTLAALERHAAHSEERIAGLGRIEARLRRARAAAATLVAGLRGSSDVAAPALIAELVAFRAVTAAKAPKAAAPRRPHGATKHLAYTQTTPVPPQFQSEAAGAPARPSARGEMSREGPSRAPALPRMPATGAAAAPAFSFFSIGGPAALALLVGLVVPRLMRRIARLPARRRPEPFAPPRGRPG